MMPPELPKFRLYWLGPKFIRDHPNEWGRDKDRLSCSDSPKIRPINLLVQPKDPPPSEWFARFSSYDHTRIYNIIIIIIFIIYIYLFIYSMIRIVAKMRRIRPKSRHRPAEVTSVLTRIELDDALYVIVVHSQQSFFAEFLDELRKNARVSSTPLARLCPFIDGQGVIRVGGRLRHSDLPFETKHPILLSKCSFLSTLICRRWHKITCNSGPRIMSAMIRRHFWIVSLRSVIHTILTRCTVYVRLDGRNPQP